MSASCNRNNRMRTPFLLAAIGLAAVLTACGDHANPTADAGAEMLPTTLSGTVRLNSGMALSGAALTLLDSTGRSVATATSDTDGRYRFDVDGERFRIRADYGFSGGAHVSASVVANLRGPLPASVREIVLPDLRDQDLLLIDAAASGGGISISGLPPQVTGLWASSHEFGDEATLPGEPETADDGFVPLGHFWFAATDAAAAPVTLFNPALQVVVPLSEDALALVDDINPGNDQIDVAIVSYNDAMGRWQAESSGELVDADGAVITEAEIESINSGHFAGEVRLQFAASHFSAYAAALFFRNAEPDWNDANAAPEIKTLRPVVPFNVGNTYEDFWLGRAVGSSETPLSGDPADDGLLTCGSETWVQASYKVDPNRGSARPAYLQVFQLSGSLADADGNDVGTDVRYTESHWVGRNLRVDGWDGQGIIQSAFVRIGGGNDVGLGTNGGALNHRNGYLRLQLTQAPISEDNPRFDTVFELGETEDYLNSCLFELGVSVSGEVGDQVSAKSQTCVDGDDCQIAVLENETVTLNATRDGAPTDVDWSISERGSNAQACARGPSCSYQRKTSVVSLGRQGPQVVVSASFALNPRVSVSITGLGQVQDQADNLNCDARDAAAPPVAEDCRAKFRPGSTVTLQATPAAQHRFIGWSPQACLEGTQSGTACSFVVAADQRLRQHARFAPFPLLSVIPGAGGRLVSTPAGIGCDGDGDRSQGCIAAFAPGTSITLEAIGNSEQSASTWTGPCLGTQGSICTFTLNDDTEVAVNFTDSALLELAIEGQGRVESTPQGIDCDANTGACAQRFPLGTRVVLNSLAAADFQFKGWGGICSEFLSNPECGFDVQQDQRIAARFGELFDWQVEVTGNGSVDGTGRIAGCTSETVGSEVCTERYVDGRSVEFFANAAQGNEFIAWGGACAAAGGASTCRVDVAADARVTAEFRALVVNHRLTLNLSGASGAAGDSEELLFCDTGTQPCSRNYAQGSRIELWAMADDSSHRYRWGESCGGTPDNSNCVIENITSPLNVSVEFFAPAPDSDPTLNVTFAGAGGGMVSDDQFRLTCSSEDSNPCSAQYGPGTRISLSATPLSTDDVFVGWTSPATCAGNASSTCSLTLDADITATVEFAKQ